VYRSLCLAAPLAERLQAERRLAALQPVECEICLQDIDAYYDACHDVVKRNQTLLQLALSRPQGAKLMSPGRVVVVKDGVRLNLGFEGVMGDLTDHLDSISIRGILRFCLNRHQSRH